MLKALLVSGAVVVAASASAATPATPLMPAYFWATFDLVGGDGYATTGAFYYDSTLAAYRVDRLNGTLAPRSAQRSRRMFAPRPRCPHAGSGVGGG
jgi:hypothetical protein